MDVKRISEVMGPIFEMIAPDAAAVVEKLGLPREAAILDVGTGNGYFAIFLAASGHQVLTGEPATDTSQYAGRNWQERATKIGVRGNIRFEHFNAESMPFDAGSFDAVFFFGVLHHIDEGLRTAVFREAVRVVRDTGTVVFFEPTQETVEKIRANDADHPEAASPQPYAPGNTSLAAKISGSFMDAYIFRQV